MNEIDILRQYISKPRQLKKINGVMTPVFIRPYDKNYNYTERFKKYNLTLVKQGLTDLIVYDDQLIYNRNKNITEPKSKYIKKGRPKPYDAVRGRGLRPQYEVTGSVLQTRQGIRQLNQEGVLYTYRQNFMQAPGMPYHTFMYRLKRILNQYTGQRILIKARLGVINWEREFFFDIPQGRIDMWFGITRPWTQFEINSGEYIFDWDLNTGPNGEQYNIDDQGRMRIFVINAVNPQRYDQAFADGVNHCVLQPVREYLEFRIDKAQNKKTSTILKYNAAMNKLIKWENKYPVGCGIPIDKLHKFCSETGFGIDLYLPHNSCDGREWKTFRPPKNPTKIFKFINTRHNHLDITAQVDNNFREKITKDEYDDILKSLWNSNEYYVYNNYSIITQTKIYQINSEYADAVKDFEKVNGLKRFKLNDKFDKTELINTFIKASCIYNATVDFQETFMYRCPDVNNCDDLERLEEYYGKKFWNYWEADNCAQKFHALAEKKAEEDRIKQIDLNKAYTRCSDAPVFENYPAKFTDLRKTNKIRGLGLYVIRNIKNIPLTIQSLGCYFENNIYPSPELKYMKSIGITFDIVAGCWGTSTKISWGPEKDDEGEWTGMYKKSEGPRNYAKWFGCAIKTTDHQIYQYRTGDKKYIENWKYESADKNVDIRYTDSHRTLKDGSIEKFYNVFIHTPKQSIYHYSHIASFIYSYQRQMMINQLLKIPYENIVRVCVDGIYYKECDFEICKNFSEDKEIRMGNVAGGIYRSINNEWTDFTDFGEDKEYNRKEVWTGAGGCGKTYENIIDKGNNAVIYIAHSWKLAAAKRDEFDGLDVSVVQRLTMDDWYIDGKVTNYWEPIANKYSTLIIDEISTLSNNSKKIIEKRFTHHKLIYCGDIGYYKNNVVTYQCPPIFNDVGDIVFQFGKGYKHYHLENNRRAKCEKLKKLLLILRKIIENNAMVGIGEITRWIEKNVDIIEKEKINYRPADMILSRTHKANFYYDETYGNLEKYYITEKHYNLATDKGAEIIGDQNIYNGQIFLERPDIPENKYKIRHGYTIDCIQGETANHNLFIDINGLYSWQHLYTAISRAKYFSQLIFVK